MSKYSYVFGWSPDDDWWDEYDRGNEEPDCMDAYHRAFEEAD